MGRMEIAAILMAHNVPFFTHVTCFISLVSSLMNLLCYFGIILTELFLEKFGYLLINKSRNADEFRTVSFY